MLRPNQLSRVEGLGHVRPTLLAASAILTMTGCSIDSYSNDTANVRCEDNRYGDELIDGGRAIFQVEYPGQSGPASITIDRKGTEVTITSAVGAQQSGDVGLGDATYGETFKIVEGPETTVILEDSQWLVNVREDDVVVSGSC